MAYWPWPPDCFTCLPRPVDECGEGLAQRHLVRYGVDLDAVAAAQAVQRHILMGLTEAPQDHLVRVLVLFEAHGRVLGDQPGEPLGELVLVRLAVRLDGERQQWVRCGPGVHQQRLVLGGEGVPGLGAAQFGDAGQISGDAGGEGALLFAEGGGECADAYLRLVEGTCLVAGVAEAVAEDVDGFVGAKGAGEDAYERDPADVRVGGRLDDLGNERAVRVAGQDRSRGPMEGDFGERALQRCGEAAGDQVQEFDGADALAGAFGGGGRSEDGVEGASGHSALQVVDECLDVDVGTAEVAVHQGLVLALGDDPLDELGLRAFWSVVCWASAGGFSCRSPEE